MPKDRKMKVGDLPLVVPKFEKAKEDIKKVKEAKQSQLDRIMGKTQVPPEKQARGAGQAAGAGSKEKKKK